MTQDPLTSPSHVCATLQICGSFAHLMPRRFSRSMPYAQTRPNIHRAHVQGEPIEVTLLMSHLRGEDTTTHVQQYSAKHQTKSTICSNCEQAKPPSAFTRGCVTFSECDRCRDVTKNQTNATTCTRTPSLRPCATSKTNRCQAFGCKKQGERKRLKGGIKNKYYCATHRNSKPK